MNRTLTCLVCGWLLVSTTSGPYPAVAGERPVKIHWVPGKGKIGDREYTLTYRDAHLKVATRGDLLNFTNASVKKGGFTNGLGDAIPGEPEDCIAIDWSLLPSDPPITGETEIGFSFSYNDKGDPLVNDVKVISATVTDVTVPDAGITTPINQLYVPGPHGLRDDRSHSVDFWFRNDYPSFSPPIDYSNVAFFLSPVEPALDDLTDAGLAALGATLLQTEPDSSLVGGSDHFVHVLGAGAGDWLVVRARGSWLDPTVSALVGEPFTMISDSFIATRVAPEPSSLALATMGLAGMVWLGRRRGRGRVVARGRRARWP